MAKQFIRLTEADLHRIVESSVERIINENMEDEGFGDYFRSLGRQGQQKAQDAGKKVGQWAGDKWNAAKTKVQNTYNDVKQGVQTMHQNAMQDSMVANMNNALNSFERSLETFKKNGGNFANAQLQSRLQGIKNMLDQYVQH